MNLNERNYIMVLCAFVCEKVSSFEWWCFVRWGWNKRIGKRSSDGSAGCGTEGSRHVGALRTLGTVADAGFRSEVYCERLMKENQCLNVMGGAAGMGSVMALSGRSAATGEGDEHRGARGAGGLWACVGLGGSSAGRAWDTRRNWASVEKGRAKDVSGHDG